MMDLIFDFVQLQYQEIKLILINTEVFRVQKCLNIGMPDKPT